MSDQLTVRCSACDLNQFAGEKCRRCRRPLPDPGGAVVEIIREVVVERIEPLELSAMQNLPTADEWEMLLIREALRRAGTARRASALIGIGVTTMYRKLKLSEVA